MAVENIQADVAEARNEVAALLRDMVDFRRDLNRRFDLLDAKLDRHFVWLAGIMMTGFMTVLGTVALVVLQLNSGR